MKKVAWILAVVFGLVLLGATLLNADLIGKSRRALASGVFRDTSSTEVVRYQLVVVIPDTDDSFFGGLVDGIEESASGVDAAVQVFRYPSSSPPEAERYYDIAVGAKVDGLIMYTPRNDRIVGRAERAAHSGVIFVPVGTDAPEGSSAGFIGSGSFLQGFEGGKRICASLGSAARVGVILPATGTGEPKDEPLYRGVASVIKAFPGASIVAAARARLGILSGEEAAATMLRGSPQVNALFCSNAQDTEGAAQVVVDMNKVGRVLIIGADETPEIRRYIEKGVVAASIVRDSKRIGEEAVTAFARVKAGRPPLGAVEVGFFIRAANGDKK
jgi:ribose transport system substrate-binding protein